MNPHRSSSSSSPSSTHSENQHYQHFQQEHPKNKSRFVRPLSLTTPPNNLKANHYHNAVLNSPPHPLHPHPHTNIPQCRPCASGMLHIRRTLGHTRRRPRREGRRERSARGPVRAIQAKRRVHAGADENRVRASYLSEVCRVQHHSPW